MVAEENNKVVLAEERMCSMTLDDLIKMSKIKSRSKKRMCSMTLDDLIEMSHIKQEAAPNRVSIPTRWCCNDAAAAAQEDRVIRHQRRFQGQKRTTPIPIPIQIDRVSVFDRISSGPNTSYDTRGSVFDRICGDNCSIEPEPVNGGASYYYDQTQAPTQTTTLDSLFATIKAQRMMRRSIRRIPNNSFGIGELRGRGN